MESEFLKSGCLLCQGVGLNEKSALIDAEKDNYLIIWMCHQLQVPRSSFYAWRDRGGKVTGTQERREMLKIEIQRVFTVQRGTAECRRIAAQLNEEGFPCSVGLVATLMGELGLVAVQNRAYKQTTVPDDQVQVFTDHVERDFAQAPMSSGRSLGG